MTTPDRGIAPGGRVRFANQLRGLAALSVAASHLVAVFWALPGVVSAVTFTPPQAGQPPALLSVLSYPWVNFGPLGVGLFFLISGLVIPFSLEKYSRTGFALARLIRIYPTYVAALLLEVAILYSSSRFWHLPFTLTGRAIISNALLIYDLIGEPSIDLVNWTLSVELKFYLLAILLAPAIRQGRAPVLLATGVAILALNGLMAWGLLGSTAAQSSTVSYTLSSHSVCLVFMLIGVAFNFHLRRLLSLPALLLTVLALAALFAGSWRLSVWSGQFPVVPTSYGLALLIFTTLYALRRFVPANPVLDGMAAISFPFYVVHSLLGYTLLRMLMVGAGASYALAIVITLAALFLLASLLHWAIEKPTIRAGHAAARACASRTPAPHSHPS